MSLYIAAYAPFTLTVGVVLLIFWSLIESGNWTFQVIGAEQGWDLREKANCCRNAGIGYIVVSSALWITLAVKACCGSRSTTSLGTTANGPEASEADRLLRQQGTGGKVHYLGRDHIGTGVTYSQNYHDDAEVSETFRIMHLSGLLAAFFLTGGLILLVFSKLIRERNWTFAVIGATHGWNMDAKANQCVTGALLHLFLSAVFGVPTVLPGCLQVMWGSMKYHTQRFQARAHGSDDGIDCSDEDEDGADAYFHQRYPLLASEVDGPDLIWYEMTLKPSDGANVVEAASAGHPLRPMPRFSSEERALAQHQAIRQRIPLSSDQRAELLSSSPLLRPPRSSPASHKGPRRQEGTK